MSGPDATLQANGARLVDQLGRDELPAFTEVRGDCDPLDVARLLAFCGDEEAEDLLADSDVPQPCASPGAEPCTCGYLSEWVPFAARLATKLPPKRVGRNQCDGCARGLPVVDGTHPGLKAWDGQLCTADSYPIHDTPAERWLMVVAAEAVARECVPACPCDVPRMDCCTCGLRETFAALDACRAWIAEPTPARWEDWARAWIDSSRQWWLLAATQCPGSALLDAADVIGADRVREIASRAIREAVRW